LYKTHDEEKAVLTSTIFAMFNNSNIPHRNIWRVSGPPPVPP